MSQPDLSQSPVPSLAFAGSACFRCYMTPPPPSTLKRCGGCRRIKFCSTDCSTAEWKDHKAFCRAFSAIRSRTNPGAQLPPLIDDSETALQARRETQRAQWMLEDDLLGAALGREPTELEAKLLWRELRCGVCWDRENDDSAPDKTEKTWRVCEKCQLQAWCCAGHEALGRKTHEASNPLEGGRTQCQTMSLAAEIDEFYLRHSLSAASSPPSLWTPSRILSSPAPLPSSWESYLKPLLPSPTPTNAQVYGVWLEALSPVLTILSDLKSRQSPFLSTTPKLVIHLLGPTPAYEGRSLPLFEEFFHQLPSLLHLELVLIGPEAPDAMVAETKDGVAQTICGECKKKNRKRSVEWIKSTYGEFLIDRPHKSKPDLIVGFHPGLNVDEGSWRETIDALTTKTKRKFLFTAQTEEEARDDQLILGMGKVERNHWSGGWPRLDGWEKEGWWKSNNWICR